MPEPQPPAVAPNRELIHRVNNFLMLAMAHCENAQRSGEPQDMRTAIDSILAGADALSGFVRGFRPDLIEGSNLAGAAARARDAD